MSDLYSDVPGGLFREGSKAGIYMDFALGRRSWGALLRYELVILAASWVPGALGLWLRSRLYPLILGSCGRGVFFGTNVVLRHPHKIHIADHVAVDDNCVLDAKGQGNQGIRIGNRVFIGRNTILACKNGDLEIGDDVSIGYHCVLFSGSSVRVGAHTLFAAFVYLVGGGHSAEDLDVPIKQQERPSKGIEIGAGAWLGTRATVLDGVRVGDGAIVGASSVVTADVPEQTIVAGTPARVLRRRAEAPDSARETR